ncbi:MAG: type II toxin-antitoxin system Phd/YefM family antitoxin [Candidatus Paceibacterota bacterium]
MNVKTTLPVSEVRKNIFKIVGEARKPGMHYTVTEKGKPRVVIMSAEEFESWQETLEAMGDFPDLGKDIKETKKAYRTGEYKKWTTLEELLGEEGFLLKEKSLKRHGISIKNQAKRGKRIKKAA